MIFNPNSKAIYLQIADRLIDQIMDGKYPEGSRAPGVREYALEVEVNYNTVTKSYEHLQQLGLIFSKRGLGYFVAPGARDRIARMREHDFLCNESPDLFRRLQSIGVTPDRLKELYINYLNTQKQ